MAINKNFVVKNGLEVSNNLIFADAVSIKVGIGTTVMDRTLSVIGDIGGTDLYLTGFTTCTNLNVSGVGTFGSILSSAHAVQSSSNTVSGYKLDPGTDTAEISIQGKSAGSSSDPMFRCFYGTNNTFRIDCDGDTTTSGTLTAASLSATTSTISGSSVFNGNIDANANLDVDGTTEVDELIATGISTFSNNIKLGTSNTHLISLDGRVNTNIVPSANESFTLGINGFTWSNIHTKNILVGALGVGIITAPNVSVGNSVTAVNFYGDGSNLTGISTSGGSGSISGINTTGISHFNNINAVGIITANNINAVGIITAQDFNSLSDINYKVNIKTVDHALDKVVQLRGVSFSWKETQTPSYGLIAQELEEVIPELVKGEDPKVVNYNGIIGVLIESIKELKEELNEMRNIISELKK